MKNFFIESKKTINIFKIKNIFCFLFLFSIFFTNTISMYSQTSEPCPAPGYNDPMGNSAGTTVDPDCNSDVTTVSAPTPAAPASKEVDCGKKDNYNCYTLLEPFDDGSGADSGSETDGTIIIKEGGLSSYLQQIITYLLMLVAVAAVFYMIYGGILYVTTDIINKKAEGKEMIQRVTYGLIFVFTVWLLINSINPNILKNSLNFSLSSIGVGIKGTSTSTTQIPGTVVPKPRIVVGTCTEGLETVQGVYQMCKSVSGKMKELLAAAAADGLTLTLSSTYRSPEKQIALRKQNCGSTDYDIYQKRSSLCKPPTALPGTSNHEKGVAVDFAGIPKDSCNEKCAWLQKNAGRFNFFNDYSITKEYWHWSSNGR